MKEKIMLVVVMLSVIMAVFGACNIARINYLNSNNALVISSTE